MAESVRVHVGLHMSTSPIPQRSSRLKLESNHLWAQRWLCCKLLDMLCCISCLGVFSGLQIVHWRTCLSTHLCCDCSAWQDWYGWFPYCNEKSQNYSARRQFWLALPIQRFRVHTGCGIYKISWVHFLICFNSCEAQTGQVSVMYWFSSNSKFILLTWNNLAKMRPFTRSTGIQLT